MLQDILISSISPDLDPVRLDDDGVVGAGGSAGVGEGAEVGEEGGDRVETQESQHQEPHRHHHWLQGVFDHPQVMCKESFWKNCISLGYGVSKHLMYPYSIILWGKIYFP